MKHVPLTKFYTDNYGDYHHINFFIEIGPTRNAPHVSEIAYDLDNFWQNRTRHKTTGQTKAL